MNGFQNEPGIALSTNIKSPVVNEFLKKILNIYIRQLHWYFFLNYLRIYFFNWHTKLAVATESVVSETLLRNQRFTFLFLNATSYFDCPQLYCSFNSRRTTISHYCLWNGADVVPDIAICSYNDRVACFRY